MNKNSLREPANLIIFKEHSINWLFGVQLFFHWMSRDEDWRHLGASQFVTAVGHQGKEVVVLINPDCFLFPQAETRTFLQRRQTLLTLLHMSGKYGIRSDCCVKQGQITVIPSTFPKIGTQCSSEISPQNMNRLNRQMYCQCSYLLKNQIKSFTDFKV